MNDSKNKKILPVVSAVGRIKEESRFEKTFKIVFNEVIYPSVKKIIYDIVTNGIDVILYDGDSKHRRSTNNGTKIQYGSYFDKNRNTQTNYNTPKRRSTYEYDTIIFETRSDAEAVLIGLEEILEHYEIVSVSDFYELSKIDGDHTSNKVGWRDLSKAKIVRIRGGYIIDLPKPMPF